jgi:hypothetical protein
MELTEFQSKCEKLLKERLSQKGFEFAKRDVCGEREPYLRICVRHLVFYVYEDGAEISGQGIDERFEKPAANSADELIGYFIQDALEFLEHPEKRSLGIVATLVEATKALLAKLIRRGKE